jgi:hypothetical protein
VLKQGDGVRGSTQGGCGVKPFGRSMLTIEVDI